MNASSPERTGAQSRITHRVVRSLAYRAAWRMSRTDAAGLVVDLLVNGAAFEFFDDRQIALIARALAGQGFLASRILARQTIQDATLIAARQLTARPELSVLDAQTTDHLAVALAQPVFAKNLVSKLGGTDAANCVFEEAIQRNLFKLLSPAQATGVATALAARPGFPEELLTALDRERATDVTLTHLLERGVPALRTEQIHALAAQLATQRDFANALIESAEDADTLEIAVTQLTARGLAGQLSSDQERELAAALARRSDFSGVLLSAMGDERALGTALNHVLEHNLLSQLGVDQERDLAAALATRSDFGGVLLSAMGDERALDAALNHVLEHNLLSQLGVDQERELAVALAPRGDFVSALLNAMGDERALDAALEHMIEHNLLRQLTPDHERKLAAALATRSDFGGALLGAMGDERALRVSLDHLLVRNLFAHLSDQQGWELASALGSRAGFVDMLAQQTPEPAMAEAWVEHALRRPVVTHLTPSKVLEVTRRLLRDTEVVNAFGNAVNDLPVATVRTLAGALARHHPNLVDEQLREVAPAFMYRTDSYAQEGEDLILARMFGNRPFGFYVDVGAMHPVRFSNTYMLYRIGWRGINIDATPGSMAAFREIRPEDINVEALITSDSRSHEFYMFEERALNTMSAELARQRPLENSVYKVVKTTTLKSRTLADVLAAHAPKDKRIDLLSIDVEGADLDVLKSNDWARYRPDVLIVELLETELEQLAEHPISVFLREQGYRASAKQYNSVFFVTDPRPTQPAAAKASRGQSVAAQ